NEAYQRLDNMKNRLLFLLTISLVVMISGCKNKAAEIAGKSGLKEVSNIEGFLVKPVVLESEINVSGSLRPFEETVLMPEVPGRVVSINLPEGKFVKKGTLLVKLFDEDLQAELHKAQTQIDIAQKNEERQKQLLQISGVSQSEYDAAALQVASIKNDIEVLKVQIGRTQVLAPFDGVIGLRNISIGAQVTPQTALATIRAVDKLKLDFSVPEKYSQVVRQGTKVDFSVMGNDDIHKAEVIATEQGIEETTRNLRARAVVLGKDEGLVPGTFANVKLTLGENQKALMVPSQAVIPQEMNKRVIVSRNGKAEFVIIKTGIRQSAMVEVTEGLKEGDTVVTTGILFIKPGMELVFSKINQK
ncbi:MAG: efflux RND transporter periplasmic adaptor subunit, partial [Syntrophothermus sp.]